MGDILKSDIHKYKRNRDREVFIMFDIELLCRQNATYVKSFPL